MNRLFIRISQNFVLKSLVEKSKIKVRTMSTIDLKRSAVEFENSSNEKRNKIDKTTSNLTNLKDDLKNNIKGDLKDNIKDDSKDDLKDTVELDVNDYRNFRIKEENVGIVEFVSDNKGFKCELKQRFSDFIVHEISSNGQIVELTNQEEPIIDYDEVENNEIDEEILELVPIELREKLEKLDQKDKKEAADQHILINVEDKNKNQRTKIHKFVSRFLSLESTTIEVEDQKTIKVFKINRDKTRKSKNNDWPKSLPVYLHFAFYQENKGWFKFLELSNE